MPGQRIYYRLAGAVTNRNPARHHYGSPARHRGLAAVGRHCASPVATSLWAAVAFMAAISQQATFWTVTMEISGKHLGVIFGLMNSMGVPGAFASTMFLGRFVDWMQERGYEGRAQWDPAFYVYAGVLFIGACCWLFVDANKHVPDGDAANA
jgi:hypothetical protein